MNKNLIGIEYNKEHNYRLYHSPFVLQHQQEFINHSKFAYNLYCNIHKNKESTWGYLNYNIFGLAVGSPHYFTLFQQVTAACRDWHQKDEPMWLQAWINYHTPEQVLKWHNHYDCTLHGYVSIDPKNTSTRFEKFSIKNVTGNIYVGAPLLHHEVIVHEDFDTPRITLAFQALGMEGFNQLTKNWSEERWSEIYTSNIPF